MNEIRQLISQIDRSMSDSDFHNIMMVAYNMGKRDLYEELKEEYSEGDDTYINLFGGKMKKGEAYIDYMTDDFDDEIDYANDRHESEEQEARQCPETGAWDR